MRIPYSDIVGLKKEGNGDEYFIFNQDGAQKKLKFLGGQPEILDT